MWWLSPTADKLWSCGSSVCTVTWLKCWKIWGSRNGSYNKHAFVVTTGVTSTPMSPVCTALWSEGPAYILVPAGRPVHVFTKPIAQLFNLTWQQRRHKNFVLILRKAADCSSSTNIDHLIPQHLYVSSGCNSFLRRWVIPRKNIKCILYRHWGSVDAVRSIWE